MIFHTSGVTERPLELILPLRNTEVKQVLDFTSQKVDSPPSDSKFALNATSNHIARRILGLTRFVLSEGSKEIIKPWTLQLRGHYSHDIVQKNLLNEFIELVKVELGDIIRVNYFSPVIQYRLGDLTQLAEKSPVSVNNFAVFLETLPKDSGKITIYSDSPELAASLIENQFGIKVNAETIDPWFTILESSYRQHFLGTNSKISIWISVIRALTDPKLVSWMPIQLKDTLKKLLASEYRRESFIYY